MNLAEYQKKAVATAVYPKSKLLVTYPAIGLGDEAGEVAEVVLAGRWGGEEVLLELGDVLWYAASLCDDLNLDLDTLKGRQVSHDEYLMPIERLTLSLCSACSKVQGRVKKSLRKSVEFDRDTLADLIGEVLTWIAVIAYRSGSHIERVAEMNLEKLAKRKSEGTIDAINRKEAA